jgi:hypothetical protein
MMFLFNLSFLPLSLIFNILILFVKKFFHVFRAYLNFEGIMEESAAKS